MAPCPSGRFPGRCGRQRGREGKYYVWSKAEVMSVLGERAGPLFCSYYDVTDTGNWEGRNILNIRRDLETVARLNQIQPAELKKILASWVRRLYSGCRRFLKRSKRSMIDIILLCVCYW
jgi:uncharacterized protein YyaL (SSP411 family)